MLKKFLEWIGLKQKLDAQIHNPPLITEGDLYWCMIGENIGVEVSGKSNLFTRPVIILKKFGRLGFMGIPTTTKTRQGTWYVTFMHKGQCETAMLSQARVFSFKRLGKKMGSLDQTDFRNVKEAFLRLFSG